MRSKTPAETLKRVAAWYFATVYGVTEGPGVLPFYCDPARVGAFAVDPVDLASGAEPALFKLFVGLTMFQARRDVLVMTQQRTMPTPQVSTLTSTQKLRLLIQHTDCSHLACAQTFDAGCDVYKVGGHIDCESRPGQGCPVKTATTTLKRMGDSGKLPTSAWLNIWRRRGLRSVFAAISNAEADRARRADLLVARFARVHRVGRKLATLFVSTLSTPALAPGLTPWFPTVDGSSLVVVDTHAASAIDALRPTGARRTYGARVDWLRRQATKLDLRELHAGVPKYAPRLVQQAIYAFGSKANRVARADPCVNQSSPCAHCVPRLCPFG